jgi:predicted O-methyltransferase YrrM
MEFLPKEIDEFSARFSEPESELLQHINRDTHAHVLMPRMLSGHMQGRMLSMLSHMIQPTTILEIGTYTGYSALCMAEGLTENGKIITIDVNDEIAARVQAHFDQSAFKSKIDYRIGNALEIIPTIDETFDLVFIDADKENYSNYFDLVIGKVRKGGIIIADNVLWSGKVITNQNKMDKDTKALYQYCKKVHHDSRVQNVLFPVRDGLMICRKL